MAKDSAISLDSDNITTVIHKAPIFIEVASCGGCIYSMQHIITHLLAAQGDNFIGTINTSRSASAAALISLFGTPGMRIAIEGSTYMFHPIQMMTSQPTPVTELSVELNRLITFENDLYSSLIDHLSPLNLTETEKENIEDLLMSTQEVNLTAVDMLKLRLVDHIIKPRDLYQVVEDIILDIVLKKRGVVDEDIDTQSGQGTKQKGKEDNPKNANKKVRKPSGGRRNSKTS